MSLGVAAHGVVGHAGSVGRTPANVFDEIYLVFLGLGTLVGIVVIGYTLYNAVKYRDGSDHAESDGKKTEVVRPSLGEIPESAGGGRKLFVSFFFSAVIVVSLILWTYSALLYVDAGAEAATEGGDNEGGIDGLNEDGVLVIDVVGQQFSWIFEYPNGYESTTLQVPRGVAVKLNVTSGDVMHNIGIPAFNAKTDAIPGQTTSTWFVPDETGTFQAACYELCGSGHSLMTSDVVVVEPTEYQEWYNETMAEESGETDNEADESTTEQNGTAGTTTPQQSLAGATATLAGVEP